MAGIDNFYSTFVKFAKIAFPLLALVFLSTLFLFSRQIDPDSAIPFASIDVEKIAREQRLASPRFTGVTADGAGVSMTASSAQPDPGNSRNLLASMVQANIDMPTGVSYKISADVANYAGETEILDLIGNVWIVTNTGYNLRTGRLVTSTNKASLSAPGPIEGTGPNATINAGSMELGEQGGSKVLVFRNGVKLVYDVGQ